MVRSLRPQPDTRSVIQPEPFSFRLFLRNLQPFTSPYTFNTLVVHVPTTILEQSSDPAVAIATVPSCQVGDCLESGVHDHPGSLAVGAALLLAVPAPCKPFARIPRAIPAGRAPRTYGDGKGLEVSLGRFFQDQLIESEISDSSLEPRVLQFQFL
jgi:hypothetical protein